MVIIQRLIFYLYTLCFTLLSIGVVLVCLNLISADYFWTSVNAALECWQIVLAGAIIFAVGGWSLLTGLFGKKREKAVKKYNLMGNVFVCVNAIEEFIEKTALAADGIRDAKVNVSVDSKTGTAISAVVTVTVGRDAKVSIVATEMQTRIQESVKETIGMELDEIKVVVETISNEFNKANSRVQ